MPKRSAALLDVLHNLCISVESKAIVRRVSLEVRSGEIHAVMGPNGAGIADKAMLEFLQPDSEVPTPENAASSARGFGLSLAKLLVKAHGGS